MLVLNTVLAVIAIGGVVLLSKYHPDALARRRDDEAVGVIAS